MTDKPPKADPAMFSDCGDAPCPEPVAASTPPAKAHEMVQGVRMPDNPAEWAFVRLTRMIEEFEGNLDKDDELGVRLVGQPGDGVLQIDDVGFWSPDMILFFGKTDQGKPIRLVQHYTQLNVLLSSRPKPTDQPARRIGFQLGEMVRKTAAARKS